MPRSAALRIAVIESRYYADIADALLAGAERALKAERDMEAERAPEVERDMEVETAQIVRLSTPGVLEIPAALRAAMQVRTPAPFDGFVALGCVIRGETGHYDIVAGESARALMDLAATHRLALGNGILTVENMDQARARARTDGGDKGGQAARACLDMIALLKRLEDAS